MKNVLKFNKRTDRELPADFCVMSLQHFRHDKLPSFILTKRAREKDLDIRVFGRKQTGVKTWGKKHRYHSTPSPDMENTLLD